eukprot:gb/GECH01008442.1/.p1 GENE.gb/GECH01008442.1/~~gb/GECH01008442.1/.p1  ORF type:complete len:486 (+),score=59.88 gb/GECH01008442.1/:1-1458(+)
MESKILIPHDKRQLSKWNIFYPTRFGFRYTMLLFICLVTFGSYYCFDNPSALTDYFYRETHITPFQYQLFYVVYNIPNTFMVFFGGLFIDRIFGVRLGGLIFAVITCVGQVVFSFGSSIHSFWVMVLGRFVFGLGGESIAVAQNVYAAKWFKGKELSLAFGITLSISRIGSSVNMVLEPQIARESNLATALWFGSIICVISVVVAIILWVMDAYGHTRAGHDQRTAKVGADGSLEHEKMELMDILRFPLSSWIIFIICVLFYSAVFPFITIAGSYFQYKWHVPPTQGSPIAGIPYTVSAIASPLFGIFIDFTGLNPIWIMISSLGLTFVYCLLIFTTINPIAPMIIMGLVYSLLAGSLWPCITIIIPERATGTAYGVMQAIQNAGLALASLVVGKLNKNGFEGVMVFFLGCVCLSSFLGLVLFWIDLIWGKGMLLFKKNRPANASETTIDPDETIPIINDNKVDHSSRRNSFSEIPQVDTKMIIE